MCARVGASLPCSDRAVSPMLVYSTATDATLAVTLTQLVGFEAAAVERRAAGRR